MTRKCVQYTYVVTVEAPDKEKASQILSERLVYDEDYGFDYSIGWSEVTVDAEMFNTKVRPR